MPSYEKNPDHPTSPIDYVEDAGDVGLKANDAALDAAAKGQATSGYGTLSLMETVMTFKAATLVCFAAAFSAATDGFQVGLVSQYPILQCSCLPHCEC